MRSPLLLLGWMGLVISGVLGCQTPKPTQGEARREFEISDLQKKSQRALKITPATVLLDARSPFLYNLSHVPHSLNLQWQDFAQPSNSALLLTELDSLSKKLAFLGIGPGTPVLVIGEGSAGHAEEGRLAWTLFYLGVTDVQTASIRHFGTQLTQQETPPPKNIAPWTAAPHGEIAIDTPHFQSELFPKNHPRSRGTFLIDVRSQKEFMSASEFNPDMTAINILWTEFINDEGRPHLGLVKKLEAVGVHRDSRIVVLSNHNVRSAAAVMALIGLGFRKVSSYVH